MTWCCKYCGRFTKETDGPLNDTALSYGDKYECKKCSGDIDAVKKAGMYPLLTLLCRFIDRLDTGCGDAE